MKLLTLALLCSIVNAQNGTQPNSTLPIVDLGYNLQQASAFNSTGGFYTFSNIRFAAPPVGDLRFAAPQSPAVDRSVVQDGSGDRICPQASPSWVLAAPAFIAQYLGGRRDFNESSFPIPPPPTTPPAPGAGQTEDCLFLDVAVPDNVFNNRRNTKVPVLVWIYGGGYTAGSKAGFGSPSGLIARSKNNGQPGVIFVALNYRLGAFGFLAGPSFQDQGGLENAALYDQRFALEWVQKYIHLFGGDNKQVTVFGESAGGGSIIHQITAFGGERPVPFQQALPQSPGFSAIVSPNKREQIFETTLQSANVTTLAQLRALSFNDLFAANARAVAGSTYGQFLFGPTVDNVFAPALPWFLLARGQFARNVKAVVGQNTNEGLLFTNPAVQADTTDAAFRASITEALPSLAGLPDQLDFIVNDLYPPVFDGSQAQGYTDRISRAAALTSELGFICNTFFLDRALRNETYSYLFAVPPAIHGADVPFTFYTGVGQPSGSVTNGTVAIALQEYITSFAQDGDPNEPGVPLFNLYGDDAGVQVLNVTGFREALDPAANRRCNYWQSGVWF